jgi:hypothetical protein
MRAYTRAEAERAKLAYELIQVTGYQFYQEVIHIILDGNIARMPSFAAEDVHTSQEL